MFSFLKDSWGHSYSEDSEEDGEGEGQGQDDKEELYTRKFSSPAEVPSPPAALEPITSPPPASSASQERIKELEEQNSKFLNQISDLQRILTTKSSLYLDYKDRYEVSTLAHTHTLTHSLALPPIPIPIPILLTHTTPSPYPSPPPSPSISSHLLCAVLCDLEK